MGHSSNYTVTSLASKLFLHKEQNWQTDFDHLGLGNKGMRLAGRFVTDWLSPSLLLTKLLPGPGKEFVAV